MRNSYAQLKFILTFLPLLSKRVKDEADRSIFVWNRCYVFSVIKSNVEKNGVQTSRGLCRLGRRVWGQRLKNTWEVPEGPLPYLEKSTGNDCVFSGRRSWIFFSLLWLFCSFLCPFVLFTRVLLQFNWKQKKNGIAKSRFVVLLCLFSTIKCGFYITQIRLSGNLINMFSFSWPRARSKFTRSSEFWTARQSFTGFVARAKWVAAL